MRGVPQAQLLLPCAHAGGRDTYIYILHLQGAHRMICYSNSVHRGTGSWGNRNCTGGRCTRAFLPTWTCRGQRARPARCVCGASDVQAPVTCM